MHFLLPGGHDAIPAEEGIARRLDTVLVPAAPAVEREEDVLLELDR